MGIKKGFWMSNFTNPDHMVVYVGGDSIVCAGREVGLVEVEAVYENGYVGWEITETREGWIGVDIESGIRLTGIEDSKVGAIRVIDEKMPGLLQRVEDQESWSVYLAWFNSLIKHESEWNAQSVLACSV